MKKLEKNIENMIVVEKSKFITHLYRVSSIDEINEILSQNNKKYFDATHNCYAYIIDNGNIQKCSDDGEPAKTAGFPMLEVLKKQEITDILAITTRYFGGIKLGASGLTRTYGQSVSEALKIADFTRDVKYSIYEFSIDYSIYNKGISYFQTHKTELAFTDLVNVRIYLKDEDIEEMKEKIKSLTNGKASPKFIEFKNVEELISF